MSRPRTLLVTLAALAGLAVLAWLMAGAPDTPGGSQLDASGDAGEPAAAAPDPLRAGGEARDDRGAPGGGASGGAPPRPPQGLRGEVRDERGRGIAGATVEVRRIDPRSLRGAPWPDGPVLHATTTERDGTFAFPAAAGDWLRVTASAPGRATVGERVASAGMRVVLVLPPAGTLVALVHDADDKPLAGARVEVLAGAAPRDALTDGTGRAILADAAPGVVSLQASAEGHGSAAAGPFVIRAGETTEAILRLPRGVSLAGVVRDAAGRPLGDAVVHLARPGSSTRLEVDAQDRFGPVVAGGVGERVFLGASAEGFEPRLEPVILRAEGVQAVALVLGAGEPWSGRVVDGRGAPVADAVVGYTGDGVSDGEAPGGASTTSDAQGRFTLPPPRTPAPGRRVVLGARKGAATGAVALRPGQLRPEPLEVVLREGTLVTGRVVDAQGRGVPGVSVRLTPSWRDLPREVHPDPATSRLLLANEEGFPGLATATGADGAWGLAGVPAGPYVVRFGHAGTFRNRAETLQVADRPVSAGTEVLAGGRTVLGEVVDAQGRAVPGAQVLLVTEPGGEDVGRTSTDAEGAFAIEGLEAGRYELVVVAAGRAPAREPVDLEAQDTLSLRVPLAEGPVLALEVSRDGAPYRGLLSVVFTPAGTGRARPLRRHVRVTSGRAEIRDAPAGTWQLDAFADAGWRARTAEVQLDERRTTTAAFALERAGVLRGRVVTADGRPVAGGYLTATLAGDDARLDATPQADGHFRFEGLAPGTYELRAAGPGGAPTATSATVAAGGDVEVTVRLETAGALDVRVVDLRGRPVAEARLAFATPEGAVRTLTPARTDRAGRAVQGDLPVGPLEVRAQGPDGAFGAAQAQVSAGATTQVEVRVVPRDG